MSSVTIEDRISSVSAERDELEYREKQLRILGELRHKKALLGEDVAKLTQMCTALERDLELCTDYREKAMLQTEYASARDRLAAYTAEYEKTASEEQSLSYIIDKNKNFDKNVLFRNIRALLRESDSVKLGQIEKDAGSQPGYMSRLEKPGNTSDPSVEFVVTAAKAFGVTIDYLVKGNFGSKEPTESYFVRFLQKLFIDTIDERIHWDAIRTGEIGGLVQLTEHPLLKLVNKTEYDEIQFISKAFGEFTEIYGTSFYSEIGENVYLYIMNIDTYRPSSTTKHNLKEVWVVSREGEKKYICGSADSQVIEDLIDNIYNLLVEWDEQPKIDEGVLSILDAYMKK